jgi:2-oxo-4-hydroxy-4-carboxy-5-ureidoimidazoline decarboxylase
VVRHNTLAGLNRCSDADFIAHLGPVFEHAPWVAQAVASQRPFASTDALHQAMLAQLHALPEPALLALLNGHPELAGAQARAGLMTADSQAEQDGLIAVSTQAADSTARWDALNTAYRERFGFPFILCILRHGQDSALRQFERRLAGDRASELAQALAEIGRISRLRLAARIADHGLSDIAGRLTTHVLDLAQGRPAAGMAVQFQGRQLRTDADGAITLLADAPLRIGRCELLFHVGDYFRASGLAQAEPPFLDLVPVVFQIAEPEGDYHVPLTVTPWAYTSYRGS